jgi:6-phosphogluconolactonase (cycloisomerase 2 family)
MRSSAKTEPIRIRRQAAKSILGVLAESEAVAAFARNKKTGVLTQLPGEAGCISENGTVEACTDAVGLGNPNSLAISPNGKSVYVTSPGRDELAVLARDHKTGALSPVQCLEDDGGVACEPAVALQQPHSVAVSPDGKRVYVAARDTDAVLVFARDKQTGSLAQLSSTDGCISDDGSGGLCSDGRALRDPRSVALSRNGRQLYVASQGSKAVAVLQRER